MSLKSEFAHLASLSGWQRFRFFCYAAMLGGGLGTAGFSLYHNQHRNYAFIYPHSSGVFFCSTSPRSPPANITSSELAARAPQYDHACNR